MNKITLVYEDDTQKITHELDASELTHIQARQAFINFLRGVGYVISEDEDLV